jgi:ATP-dependent DNA ligase
MGDFDHLAVKPGLAPMEAKLVDRLPDEPGWQYEPKWDGFRCLAWRDGDAIELRSKSGKSLGRFFPEVAGLLRALGPSRFILDGELIIPIGDALSFEALQMRLHPAESRVRKLARETPAQFMLFDCLQSGSRALLDQPLSARRAALEELHAKAASPSLLLSPLTLDPPTAQAWLERTGGALDGIVAKRRDKPYRPGERAMLKVKRRRSADCVVGGFRYASGSDEIGSLLLGLYDGAGRLDHVGFTSAIPESERKTLKRRLEALIEPPGFSGKAPGGPSRWSTARSVDWHPLRPTLVVEVLYDQVTADRFRHGTRFLRWRPDKDPAQCTMDQLEHELRPAELASALGTSTSG